MPCVTAHTAQTDRQSAPPSARKGAEVCVEGGRTRERGKIWASFVITPELERCDEFSFQQNNHPLFSSALARPSTKLLIRTDNRLTIPPSLLGCLRTRFRSGSAGIFSISNTINQPLTLSKDQRKKSGKSLRKIGFSVHGGTTTQRIQTNHIRLPGNV